MRQLVRLQRDLSSSIRHVYQIAQFWGYRLVMTSRSRPRRSAAWRAHFPNPASCELSGCTARD